MKEFNENKFMTASLQISSYLLFFLISLVVSVVFLAMPILLNSFIVEQGVITFENIFIILFLITTGYGIQALSVIMKNRLQRNYHVKATGSIYRKVFKTSYDRYIEIGPSTIQSRSFDTIGAYADIYFFVIPALVVNSIVFIGVVVVSFLIDPIIGVVMFLLLPFNYYGYKALNKKLSALSVEMSKVCGQAWRDEDSIVSQVDFIKQNADNEKLVNLVMKHRFKNQDITRRVNNVANGVSRILAAMNHIAHIGLVVYVMSLLLMDPTDAGIVGGAVFIMIILPFFSTAITSLTNTNLSFAQVSAAKDFLNDIVSNITEGGTEEINGINEIKFDLEKVNIGELVLLENVAMSCKKGDIIGIMGESGKGKSSLVKLLLKFRQADGIFIDGKPIGNIATESYLKHVSYYSQNTPIITDTLYNNLNFGREDGNRDLYKKLPLLQKFGDLDEIILENGANLSGGDKQRIALARFFAENTDVVVLDEPTNSLDKETEEAVLSEIMSSCENKIVFLISHNAENMKYCNRVFEIKDKKLLSVK
ncbi:MAG: ABC transporter ATP-binding protein/permease [Defluviitaleaceae bacterium]|nr:ABC transporter ATP-binding protein/permease [Defluviitaleaceae bacterium]